MKRNAALFPLLAATVTTAFAQLSGELRPFYEAEKRIVRLPPTAFPELPGSVVQELQRRKCTIPQEAFSKQPHNVIKGEFARPGQTDWAALCSVGGVSRIIVFWNSSEKDPAVIAAGEDFNCLQGIGPDKIGYSRLIQPVGKGFIVHHHQAYGGHTPPPIDHQGIDDAFVGKVSVTWYFHHGKWMKLTGAD